MTGRGGGIGEMERGEIKVCTTDTVKTQASALREAHKQSDRHYIHRHTHNHTYMHCLRPVCFGNAKRSHRARGRTGGWGWKGLSQFLSSFRSRKLCRWRQVLYHHSGAERLKVFISPLFYIKTLKTASHFPRLWLVWESVQAAIVSSFRLTTCANSPGRIIWITWLEYWYLFISAQVLLTLLGHFPKTVSLRNTVCSDAWGELMMKLMSADKKSGLKRAHGLLVGRIMFPVHIPQRFHPQLTICTLMHVSLQADEQECTECSNWACSLGQTVTTIENMMHWFEKNIWWPIMELSRTYPRSLCLKHSLLYRAFSILSL